VLLVYAAVGFDAIPRQTQARLYLQFPACSGPERATHPPTTFPSRLFFGVRYFSISALRIRGVRGEPVEQVVAESLVAPVVIVPRRNRCACSLSRPQTAMEIYDSVRFRTDRAYLA
jgi:hypothetical protein